MRSNRQQQVLDFIKSEPHCLITTTLVVLLVARRFNRGFAKRPINSLKNVVDQSGVIPAITDTLLGAEPTGFGYNTIATAIDSGSPAVTATSSVAKGCTIKGIYLSLFLAEDTNSAATEVNLADWYIIYDKGGVMGSNFTTSTLPTPGATGSHRNKNKILHEEKGLIGEKNDGSKMVFQGVIRIPRGMQRMTLFDEIKLVIRTNQASIFCLKAIYKYYQ